jgi:glycosyltransferase involved in cell wall biosynthesis
MNRQRVCFVALSSYGHFNSQDAPIGGGVERQLYLVARELRDDFEVHFVVGDYGQNKTKIIDDITLHRAYQPTVDAGFFQRISQFVRLYLAMKRANADVYIFRGSPKRASFIYLITRLLDSKLVYNIACDSHIKTLPGRLNPLIKVVFKQALRNADALLSQTDKQKKILEQTYNISSIVVPNGYPLAENIQPYSDRKYFLWVGRIDKDQKQPHLYMDLAEAVPGQDFLLIGPPGNDDSYYKKIVERTEEIQNIKYVGVVEPDKIHQYYQNAISLVNTSEYEGFPNTFLEAWRYKTPVISLSVDPNRFISSSNSTGYAANDFDKLVNIARGLVDNPEQFTEIVEPAYQYFQENLTIESTSDRYADALQFAIKQNRTRT